ncbi:MAG: hypothetical protein EXR48_02550 [Dehalococcoidia bacterium]|nr:hypothetical protein [Dehalococcoidia bacterium]
MQCSSPDNLSPSPSRRGGKIDHPVRLRPPGPRGAARARGPVRKAGEHRYFKETITNLGVSTPTLHRLERELFARVRRTWGPQDALALCEEVLPKRVFEATILSLLTLSRFARKLGSDAFDRCEAWLANDYCDNWGATDTLGPKVIGPIL